MDSLNGEEKKDASKEDLEQEEGKCQILLSFEEFFKHFFKHFKKKTDE